MIPLRGGRRAIDHILVAVLCRVTVLWRDHLTMLGEHSMDHLIFLALKFEHCYISHHLILLKQLLLAARFRTGTEKKMEVDFDCNSKKCSHFPTKLLASTFNSVFLLIIKNISCSF